MRQQRMVAAVLAGVVVTSGAGWAAGSKMRSPAQVAADTAPPEASLITAGVEKRTLSSAVTTRGTVRYGEPQTVSLAASSLGSGGGGGGANLVTKPPEKGKELTETTVALEVAGRPVNILQGELPMYRDLRPGDTGPDVRQLEEALARLGFSPGKVDGTYDAGTEGAVDAWYEKSGYTAQGPTDEQRDALRAARAAVSSAEDRVLQARESLDKVMQGVTARDVAMAESEVRGAQRDRARAGEDLDAATADEASAAAAVAAARAEEDAARRRADADVAAAESAVREAERAMASAPGPDASAALDQARRALDEARRSGEAAVSAAAAATRQATDMAVKAARAVPEAARMVAASDDKLALARVSLEALKTPSDTATARAMVAKADRDVADARRQLAELDGEVGVVVPADEVLFFPTLPLRVDEPKVARGDDGAKEVMVVSTSRLAIDASVSIPDAALVKVGDKVAIRSTELGIEASGVVSELASKPGTDGVDAQKVYMEVVPDDPPAELTGASVRLSIAVRSTGGDVLAVPVAALSVGSDGASRVQVAERGGGARTVEVEPGLSAQGFVEVAVTGGAKLAEGDRVVVGTSGSGSSDRSGSEPDADPGPAAAESTSRPSTDGVVSLTPAGRVGGG